METQYESIWQDFGVNKSHLDTKELKMAAGNRPHKIVRHGRLHGHGMGDEGLTEKNSNADIMTMIKVPCGEADKVI